MVERKLSPEEEQGAEKSYPPNLPKNEIITDNEVVRSIYRSKNSVQIKSGIITAVVDPWNNWGFTVLVNKTVGSAVFRNRAKRLSRAVYRTLKTKLAKPHRLVFNIDQKPRGANNMPSYQQLLNSLYTPLKNDKSAE